MAAARHRGGGRRPKAPDVSAHGQAATSRALAELAEFGWVHLDEPAWPGRTREVVDHLVVGPGGVLVIDTVQWAGHGTPTARRLEWEAVQLRTASNAIAQALPGHQRLFVRPILCLVGDAPVHDRAGTVIVCSTASVVPTCHSLPTVLTPAEAAVTLSLVQSWQEVEEPPRRWRRRDKKST